MIFKTFNNDSDKLSSKIGILGKSFNEYITIIRQYYAEISRLKNSGVSPTEIKNQVGSLWGNLFPSQESVRAQIIDVDSLIPKMDTATAQSWIQQLTAIDAQVQNGTMTWQQYHDSLDEGQRYIAQWGQTTQGQIRTSEGLQQANESARASIIAQNQTVRESTLSFKAATIAGKAFGIALNMIAFAAIAKGISLIANKISEMSNATENAIQAGQSFANSLKQTFSNVSENASTLSDLNEEYQRLSKGVDDLGRNVSLTTPEYNRYKEIISQIHGIMPELNTYFNDQGEAIGFVGGKLEDTNKEYEKYLKNTADDFFNNGDKDGNTPQSILDEYATTYKKTAGDNWLENMFLSFGNTFKKQKNIIGLYDYTADDVPTEAIIKQLDEIQNKTKEEVADYLKDKKNSDYNFENEDYIASRVIESLLGKSSSEIGKMSDEDFDTIQQTISQQITNLKSSIENKMSDVRQVLMNELYRNDSYWAIDDTAVRENITTFISSINSNLFNALDISDMNSLDIFVDKLIKLLKNNPDFSKAWTELFSINEDIPVTEYTEKVRNYIDIIADALGIDEDNRIQWMISLGFDLEADEASILGLKEKLSSINGGAKNQDAAKWVDTLTKKELELAHSDEFINALEEQKKKLGNASLKAQDYETALDGVKSAQNNLKDAEKITTISGILEKFGQTEAIDEYKDKISSLQSYLKKLEDSDYSPADLESLAEEFDIIGNNAEERIDKINDKIQSEKNNIIAVIDEIIAKGLADGSIGEAELERLRSYKNILKDIADVNLDKSVNFDLSGNALADIQKLSDGLDQLDKIYADILDKEDFDFSSILNNDSFKEAFSTYTDEYDNFINTVSKSPDDINACQDAFNKLTAAYIKGTGILSEVTEATKAGTIAMLKQMGVSNAVSIVEQALIENEKMLEAQKYATAQGCDDLRKATYEEINALIAEGKTTEEVLKYLAKLALEKWKLSKTELKTQADCDNLLKLADYAGATAEQIGILKDAINDLNKTDITNPIETTFNTAFDTAFETAAKNLPGFAKSKLYNTYKNNKNKSKKKDEKARKTIEETVSEIEEQLRAQLEIPEFKVDYTGGTTTKDTIERLQKEKEKEEKKKEETAEQFDWMDIKLNNLIDTASKLKDKISDLLSFGSKKKQTQKAIEATTKALEAEYKAMKKYAEVAKTLSADAAKKTTETVTESISGAVSDAVNGAVTNIVSSTAGVVNDAMQYVDKLPYVWGGESLVNGADCSGFVMQLYKKYGINLPHNAQMQFNSGLGTKVYNQQELQPGDLVFFGSGANNIHHVGIYAGDGKFIEERGRKWGTKLSPLAGRDYYAGLRFGNISNTSSSSATSSVSYDTPSTTTTTYTKVVPGIDSKTLAHYQKLVREGSFDVETITNEKLKNAIKSYQEWYEKMKSCRDKIEELNNTLKELYKTMAQIPIEKRDKNVDTLDTRLDILNSKRENISAVIVDPKKYASTQKTLKTSKTSVKKGLKGLRTKAQMKSAGLTKNDIKSIQDQMKKGQTIPAKILDKITDATFYEQCKQYNDAVYEHSQYAKSIRTAGDSIKKFNTISDQILTAEKSKTKQYKTAYNDISKSYGKSLDHVKAKGNKTRKAFGSKKFGLTDADIKRIKSCISAGKQIPTDLMAQLESQSIYDSCVEYNKAVMENEAFREQLDAARFDLQKQQQAETAARLQNKTEKHQNIADKASAKMERNEALVENADTPKKKNKYLSKNLDLLQTEYKHLIKIAELENDSVKAAKLRAELEKETADIIEQQFQNISDYYSARREKISDKEALQDVRYENALVDVKKKNDILNVKTRFASERNAESEQEYTDTAKLFNSNRTDAKKTVNKVKKLSSSDKEKILKLMESKEEIPENLMDKVAKLDPDAYQKLLNYNDSLDWLEKAALNKKISNEELIKAKRENEIQKHQNVADRAQDKMDKNDALSEISTSASEQNQYEKENIKYLNTQYKHLLEIAKLHEDDVEYARLEAEQQAKIAEAYKAMFDNVQTEFENKISLISNDISDLDNEIKKVEASGRLVDASYYNHKISFENESLAKLKEEETSLVEQLKNVKMFSSAWYECQDAIQSVQDAQAGSLVKVKEYKDAINEIADTIQNDIVNAFHDVTDEAELLITLLGDDLSDEDTGALTKDGLAVLSLYVTQMNICKDAAESFQKEIQSMQEALDSGTLSFIDANGVQREYASVFELKKAIKDFYASYRDEVKHTYDYESKIVDMMIKKYQSELDYLKELIEKKKAELDAEKD